MKRSYLIPALLLCIGGFLTLNSCSNGDNSNLTPTVIENNVKTGSSRITSFIDSGQDETNHFTGYSFTFGTNGSLTASNGSGTQSGSWNITDSTSNDDNPNDLHFNIFFNLTNDFEDLNEDWNIVSQSSTRIELIHVSGGNGGTDLLTFEKV